MEEKNTARLRKPHVNKLFPISVKKIYKYETPSNSDGETERDAESVWRTVTESYFIYACECLLKKKRKREKSWIRDETDVERSEKRKGLKHHKD